MTRDDSDPAKKGKGKPPSERTNLLSSDTAARSTATPNEPDAKAKEKARKKRHEIARDAKLAVTDQIRRLIATVWATKKRAGVVAADSVDVLLSTAGATLNVATDITPSMLSWSRLDVASEQQKSLPAAFPIKCPPADRGRTTRDRDAWYSRTGQSSTTQHEDLSGLSESKEVVQRKRSDKLHREKRSKRRIADAAYYNRLCDLLFSIHGRDSTHLSVSLRSDPITGSLPLLLLKQIRTEMMQITYTNSDGVQVTVPGVDSIVGESEPYTQGEGGGGPHDTEVNPDDEDENEDEEMEY